MVVLDKTTKTPPASSSSTATSSTSNTTTSQTTTHNNNNNLQKNGIKKATYSVINENQNENVENIDPQQLLDQTTTATSNSTKLTINNNNCHDNPVFEADNYKSSGSCGIINNSNIVTINTEVEKDKYVIHAKPSHDSSIVLNEQYNETARILSVQTQNQLNNSNSYSIGANTTLVYITSPPQNNSVHSQDKVNYNTVNTTTTTASTSFNTADKLAAAAAVVSSAAADSLVEIPNFGEGLSSMMDHHRLDDIEISNSKKYESSKINQSHGFTFGEANNQNATYTKSACQTSNSSSTIISEDDGHVKLTPPSYQVKIRRRRACQMKALIVILAILAAACIGCIIGYFFIEYSKANQRHMELVKNMVSSRKSKFGSNKLEVIVPFKSSTSNSFDTIPRPITNKINEMIHQTFIRMNKTVEVMKYYDPYLSIDNASFLARIDVELENAVDFSTVPLKASHGRIGIDKSAKLLKLFKNSFRNITVKENLNRNLIQIDFDNIEILFGQRLEESETSSNQTSEIKTSEGSRIFTDVSAVTSAGVNLASSSKNSKISQKSSSEAASTKASTLKSSPITSKTPEKFIRTETSTKEASTNSKTIPREEPTTKIVVTEPSTTSKLTTISSSSSSSSTVSKSTKIITTTLEPETTSKNIPTSSSPVKETTTSVEIKRLFSTSTIAKTSTPVLISKTEKNIITQGKTSSNSARTDPFANLPRFTPSLKTDSTSMRKETNGNRDQSNVAILSSTPSMLTSHPAEDLVMDLIVDPQLLKSVLSKDPQASENINNEIEKLLDQFLKEKQQTINEPIESQSRQLLETFKNNLSGIKQVQKRSQNSIFKKRFKNVV